MILPEKSGQDAEIDGEIRNEECTLKSLYAVQLSVFHFFIENSLPPECVYCKCVAACQLPCQWKCGFQLLLVSFLAIKADPVDNYQFVCLVHNASFLVRDDYLSGSNMPWCLPSR